MSLYFAIASLPKLEFDAKPDTTTVAVIEIFEMNLSGKALEQLKVLRRWIDLRNLSRVLHHHTYFDYRGNESKSTLKECLESQQDLPQYFFDFLSKFDTEESQKKNFSYLIADYFRYERKKATGLLKEFLQFENEWRIILASYMTKKSGRNLGDVLRFEDMNDPIIQIALVQKDSPGQFVFPFEYSRLELLLKEAGSNPTKQMLAIAKYRFDFYAEMQYDFPFTLRRAFAYLMQLMQLEEVYALDELEGTQELMKLMENEHAS